MKKFIALAMIFSVGLLFAFTSCGGGKIGGTVQGETFKTEGWLDDNTYRLAAACVPTKTITNKFQRRESSKRAAIINAQYQIL
jgi:hypothetical protein